MRAGERGYALLLALVVVATLAFVVLASARVLNDVTVSTVRLQESRNEVVAAESLLSRAAFLLLTEEIGPRSLIIDDARFDGGSLNLDGSWYLVRGVRDASIAVQDEAGLFNLNSTDQQALAALLALDGQATSAELAATLMDYTDADDLTRDRGAEGRAYARAGLAPPADRALSSRWQALEAMGWREARLDRGAAWPWLSAGPVDMALNVNTAPAAVLQALLGDRRRAESLVAQREVSPFRDLAEVEALTGGTARADGVTFAVAPARGFRVQAVFGSRRARHGIERRLELGDAEAERPFEWVEEREVRLAPLRDGESINSLSLDAPAS
jgi:type II secretory pathway component PulK